MANITPEAVSMATKLAAQAIRKNQTEIAKLTKTVTAQAQDMENSANKDRAFKLAAKLVVGEDALNEIHEKAAGLMRENLDIVEKAMDLGLSQGLKLGHVLDNNHKVSGREAVSANALIDFLSRYSED